MAEPHPLLIIFDCDGVLIDSEPIACGAVAAGLQGLGIDISVDDVLRRYTGVSASAMYADIEARHGRAVSVAERAAIGNAVDARLAAEVEATPGMHEALRELAGRFAFCVASSSSPTRLSVCLQRTGLAPFFGGHVFSALQVARGKPAPDLFLHAAARMAVDPQRCTVVEDSVAGAEAARAAGMRCFGFVGGGHATHALAAALRDRGAACVFDSMPQLPALLGLRPT